MFTADGLAKLFLSQEVNQNRWCEHRGLLSIFPVSFHYVGGYTSGLRVKIIPTSSEEIQDDLSREATGIESELFRMQIRGVLYKKQ